jgi:hypothetical protein
MNYPLLVTGLFVQAALVIASPQIAHSKSYCIDENKERMECIITPITDAIFSVTYPDQEGQDYYAEIINQAADGSCYVTFIDNETYVANNHKYYQTDEMKCSRKGRQYITDIDGEIFIYVFR